MKKNSGEISGVVGIDAINEKYYITIPEWLINEMGWYEETEVKISVDGKDLIITENSSY